MEKITAKNMRLGDIIKLKIINSLNTAIVKKINDKAITISFYRPYTSNSDFIYCNGIMCFISIEEFDSWIDSNKAEYELTGNTLSNTLTLS